jgi:uncharacterized protein
VNIIRALPIFIGLVLLTQQLAGAVNFDEEDFKRARKDAERGDLDAALALGMMYYAGAGTPQNYDEALKWYRRAAEQGNPVAQNSLGVMYLQGHGVRANPAEGAKWIRAAAEQGDARAQVNLGQLHAQGRGVPLNHREATRWFHRAAEQGDAGAQVTLGQLYAAGRIVPQRDVISAYQWFLLAAAQGEADGISERDALAKKITPAQVTEAQRRAAAFAPRKDPGQPATAKASGTGFIVTRDGHLLTAYHLVESSTNIVARTKQLRFAVRLLKADPTNDIALLKIIGAFAPTPTNSPVRGGPIQPQISRGLLRVSSNFRPLTVTDAEVKLGEPIATLGFPNIQIQGREAKFTRGEINSLAGIKDDARYFQISAPVQPGNSGGPLFDASGKVIGMVLARLNDLTLLKTTGSVPQNVNYALKSGPMLTLLRSLPATGESAPPTVDAAGAVDDWLSAAQDSVVLIEVY